MSFWEFNVWGGFNLVSALLFSLLMANVLKKSIKFLNDSLIPTSVLGGVILLIISSVYKVATGNVFFDLEFFGGKGTDNLEIITYHTLALGFISSALKNTKGKINKERSVEVFNTGVTTVSTYLLQGIVGMGITIIAAYFFIDGFFEASGLLLPFGYGQGTGQALNFGNLYESEGFSGGSDFGLTIAALGFLSASIGGVIHLNIIRKRIKIKRDNSKEKAIDIEQVQGENEIPMQGSMDKLTIQLALVAAGYFITYILMFALGQLLPNMRSVIFGFNFILGVISAALIKIVINFFTKKKIIKKQYSNDFLLTRISNFFFDVMVVAGIAAIRLDMLERYWGVIIVLGVVGLLITYAYNLFVAKKLFPDYCQEQFLMMYGMLTGTASTGVILLREIDGEFKTPASDNLVYQNFPAIVFGFPLMYLALLAPKKPILTLLILILFFAVMNLILFRSFIFKRKRKNDR